MMFLLGETSAGKSSLINLLLNDSVMPTSIMQNTLTICEISYGPTKQAVVHFAKRSKPSRVLEEKKFHKIKEYVEKTVEDENWCERIEIKIPNPLLEVTIFFCSVKHLFNDNDLLRIETLACEIRS